jgi:hypothetical protein
MSQMPFSIRRWISNEEVMFSSFGTVNISLRDILNPSYWQAKLINTAQSPHRITPNTCLKLSISAAFLATFQKFIEYNAAILSS